MQYICAVCECIGHSGVSPCQAVEVDYWQAVHLRTNFSSLPLK